ncbi:MAG: adenine phosphoribosyltransferase [Paracoccaceae bacterium]
MKSANVKDYIRTIVDFPHEGIMFRDVTTLFADPRGFRMTIDQLLHPYAGERIDKVVGLEARGFIIGGAIAPLSLGFVPIRKKGKLPGATLSEAYQARIRRGGDGDPRRRHRARRKVLVVDDLLTTGGTAAAGIKLINGSAARSSAAPSSSTCPRVRAGAPCWKTSAWMSTCCASSRA